MVPQIFAHIFTRHRIDSRILMVFLVTAVGALIFLRLGSEVREGDNFALDRLILRALRGANNSAVPIGPAWLQGAMIDITALGGVTILTLLTALTAGYLLASGKTKTAIFVTIAITSGAILSNILKFGYARPRPDLVAHLVDVHSLSFPSGHAMNSAITYLTLGALLSRAEGSRSMRIFLMGVAIFLTLTIGFSRVYLGVHWPSDVVAGWCVGASWAALCSLVARSLQRGHKIDEPGSISAGHPDQTQG